MTLYDFLYWNIGQVLYLVVYGLRIHFIVLFSLQFQFIVIIIQENLGGLTMRFKSIEVTGFKSFSERTKISFQPGITAIVGPNGCGKSNVSDALRWALGEQSAKQIRGEKMEDVIFNGTRSRAPVGMAEVNLVITDLDTGIASDFANFDEIQITRRYYRSGESEYLINRIPCRLMDIRELFMDTGMGAKAYSIIGQGSISAILNAKPKERRFLFEEAAGISKYKARKDEALRKLERTRDNLSRVRDIIAEVTRQRNSLNRQAKKAERYKAYKDEIQEIDLHLSSKDLASQQQEWNRLEQEYHSKKSRETELLSLTSAKETRIEDLELEVLDREKSLSELQEETHRIESEISREENRVQVLTSEITHLNNLSESSNKEILRLQEEMSKSRSATDQLEEELAALAEEIQKIEESLAKKEDGLTSLLSNQEEEERIIEKEKGERTELMRQIAIQKNRIENMARERDSLLELHVGFDSNHTELMNRLSHTQEQLSEKNESLSRLKAAIEEERREHQSVLTRLEEKQETLSHSLEQFSRLREQMGQESSRLATLIELQENLEGYDEGIRSLVQDSKAHAGSGSLPEIHALVANIFETDPRHEVAIESAINSCYQSLVLNGPDEALQAVEYLKEHEIGRGSFIPLQPKNQERDPFIPQEGRGVVGEALNLVRFDPRFSGVAEYLLGNVVITENLEQSIALYRSNGFHRTLVTLNGEVLDPSGTVEGGGRKKNTSGFIRRKREIRELKISLDVLKGNLLEAEEERNNLTQEISQIKNQLSEITSRMQPLEAERVDLEKEVSSLTGTVDHIRQAMDGLSHENDNRSSEILSLEESLAACRHQLQGMDHEQEVKSGRISSLTDRIHSLREEVDQERRVITEDRVHLASIKEKSSSLISHIEKNRLNSENLNDLIQARRREIEDATSRIQQAEIQKAQTEASIHTQIQSKQEVYEQVIQEQEMFEAKRKELQEEQKAFKELRHENEDLNRKVNELEVRRTELSIKMDHLVTRIQEKYQVALQMILPTYQEREIDREQAKERLEELNRKIDQMGAVNITAIEEYNALQERFEFLTTQEADLQESVESLMTAIRKINRTSRQRFHEAFDSINEKFKAVFKELFEGGQAELRLEEGEDILDAGVEIIAQPPGKKLQHLSLLSGGESALTAVALIFAGFLVKPSPFCLLDEVDAPLDDVNVERYNNMLKRMSRDTQFIVITHNKNSMEHAGALYGITMQEAGVSKMVSVQFNDGHEAKMSA